MGVVAAAAVAAWTGPDEMEAVVVVTGVTVTVAAEEAAAREEVSVGSSATEREAAGVAAEAWAGLAVMAVAVRATVAKAMVGVMAQEEVEMGAGVR